MHSTDPITNAIYGGIKKGIVTCLENECFGSAIVLIYSGIDTMAFLGMPDSQIEVNRTDFINWCDRFLKLPNDHVTGLELYGARCGVVHSYGVESRASRSGDCRVIGYSYQGAQAVKYNPQIDPNFVLIPIETLAQAFFEAIDRYLVWLFADPARNAVIEARCKKLLMCIPVQTIDQKIEQRSQATPT